MIASSLDLKEDVIERLAFDPKIISDNIAVTAKNGIVTLVGMVPSLYQKWEVEKVVKATRGVQGIADELRVDLPMYHLRSDTDIALAIGHRFASNGDIPSDVQFVVKNGHVTLSGEVAWFYQSQEAVREAGSVVGVQDVTNEITLRPIAVPNASEVLHKIQAEFQRTADLDAKNVEVEVNGSAVTLSGTVHSWLEHDRAAQAAWGVPGITRVSNQIVVTA
jgi:osmotically-inducible protein OsmY